MSFVDPDEWQPQGITELEDRAWAALRETDRSVCVTAGAGAGKTEFLAQKATFLLQTGLCPPSKRILAISFKRDAAETLSKRVRLRCQEAEARRFVSLTFDAFTKSLIDQFGQAIPAPYTPPADYQITFPTADILRDFLDRAQVHGITPRDFEKGIAIAKLPIGEQHDIPEKWRNALRDYWRDQYEGQVQSFLTFAMINWLAEYLLRTNANVLKALRNTYPIVFLDEFQDTTSAQFEFLLTAFDATQTIFTAVGDDKQKIMGWAGAMDNAFGIFKDRCNARSIHLLLNWRSHEDLVAIQHIIAQQIDPNVEAPQARAARSVDGEISAIWQFNNRDEEITSLAAWIASEIDSGDVEPEDIAILVRMRANDVEEELLPAFEKKGLALRNLARQVGDIAIQDLLVEPLTQAVLPFLRLGSSNKAPEAWGEANETIQALLAAANDDPDALQQCAALTEDIARQVKAYMRDHLPTDETAKDLALLAITAIGESVIRQANPAYSRQADYLRVQSGLVELLHECAEDAEGWGQVLDRFEGKGQVQLMTIHKSKGMEFHTMIFFGLDNQSWWSLSPQRKEELNSFFVAFTRARQRAFFTCCIERGGPIGWLDSVLDDVVPRTAGCSG